MSETSGKIDFVVGDETFQTWYKVIGDLKSGIRPLVTLHGGPGIAHHYMLPHVGLHASHHIPVIFYDQIGIGQSTHLPHKPKTFWTTELFMDELDNLLTHLGIVDNYDLVGHSWGGMLAASYVCSRHPPGLNRLILVGTPASMELWETGTQALLQGLPEGIREMLKRHEEAGTTNDPEYQRGMQIYYVKHVCKLDPRPEELREAKAALTADPTVYKTMIGPSEFFITGTLKTWSVLNEIHTITQPTLIINGVDDEAQDVCVAPFFEKITKAKWVQFMNSAHMPFFEEKERYICSPCRKDLRFVVNSFVFTDCISTSR